MCQFVPQLTDRQGYRESAEGPAEDEVATETQVGHTRVTELINIKIIKEGLCTKMVQIYVYCMYI